MWNSNTKLYDFLNQNDARQMFYCPFYNPRELSK